MTVVSYTHEVIFLKTRKTAGTSLEMWLSSIAGPSDILAPLDPVDEAARSALGLRAQNFWVPVARYGPRDAAKRAAGRRPRLYNHMPAAEVRDRVGRRVWDSFLKITVERDPYDRAISMHQWKTRGRSTNRLGLLEFLQRFPVEKLANAPIYSIDGEVVADVVLNYETLAEDTLSLQRFLGLPDAPLPHSKVSAQSRRDSQSEMSEEARRIIELACRRDVALSLLKKRISQVRP